MNRTLTLSKKTGFVVVNPYDPVNIRDYRGILFYSTEPILPVSEFNLPSGKYLVDSGNFKAMAKPKYFKLEKLPIAETAFPIDPSDFLITFAPNKNKCSIFWKEKMIVFDTSFSESPLPQLFFILFHEYGHSRYGMKRKYSPKEAEAYCDLYASNKMLEMGFNPSQIERAPKDTLSSGQNYRKDFIETVLHFNAYKK